MQGGEAGDSAAPTTPERPTTGTYATGDGLPRRSPRLAEQETIAWLGLAEKLDSAGKEIISHYKHSVMCDETVATGEVMKTWKIKYQTVYEPPHKARVMGKNTFNVTRLGDYLLTSSCTPEHVKERVARMMRSKTAKTFMEDLSAKRKASLEQGEAVTLSRKATKAVKVRERDAERRAMKEKYDADFPEREMPAELMNLCVYFLSIFLFMCRLPFNVIMSRHFWNFAGTLRPTFSVRPRTLRDLIANDALDEAYEEAKEIAESALAEVPGRPTLGMDGHKEGKRRHVETVTKSKLGISTYVAAHYMGTTRATGMNLANLAIKYLTPDFIALVADNTSNNTGESHGLFAHVQSARPTLFCLGCYVHVLDLLIEDVAKLPKFKAIGDDAHFCVGFLRKHGLLFEEFLLAQERLDVKVELVLFPATRFAYLHLMLSRALKNASAMRLVVESCVFTIVQQSTRKRGQEGEKASAEFERFASLVESRAFRDRLRGAVSVLEPISQALHYSEGDSVPLSHILPLFQTIYDFSQQLEDFPAISDFLDSDEERDEVMHCVSNRWIGRGRSVGLRTDVHMLAFVLDPYVQAALTKPTQPVCDLLDGDIMEGARLALRHMASDDAAKRSVLLQQLALWIASAPRVPPNSDIPNAEAVATGNTAFSSFRLAAMQQIWDKVGARAAPPEGMHETSAAMNLAIADLKTCPTPTGFWLAMMNELPRGARAGEKEAHMLFCKMAADVCSIVGHTCGVERAGKSYNLVVSPLRKSLQPARAMKLVYINNNYDLLAHKHMSGGSYGEFSARAPPADDDAEFDDGVNKLGIDSVHVLRRGNLIFAETQVGGAEDSSDEGDEGDEGESDDDEADGANVNEVTWSLPSGFSLAPEPLALDRSLIGKHLFMRWQTFGWQLGKIVDIITQATPRLFRKFNYRILWSDGSKGPAMLDLSNYGHGVHARYDSWVLLDRAEVE